MIENKKCSKCDNIIKHPHTPLEVKEKCHSCNFWQGKVFIKNKSSCVIINGLYYWIDKNEDCPKHCKGFYGDEHVIEFFDGRIIKTTNLWYNGKIPAIFREELKDNARFKE